MDDEIDDVEGQDEMVSSYPLNISETR